MEGFLSLGLAPLASKLGLSVDRDPESPDGLELQ